MCTTQPIRDLGQLKDLKDFYQRNEPNLRNYAMISLGINSALRISDLLHLKWRDVFDFYSNEFHYHMIVMEHKTSKVTRIALNKSALAALSIYKKSIFNLEGEMYLFPGREDGMPLSRSQAFRIIRHAADILHLERGISCHSMRKTFGYHAWKCGIPPAVLMEIYNHSSYEITKRYLGIEQEDKDSVFFQVNL